MATKAVRPIALWTVIEALNEFYAQRHQMMKGEESDFLRKYRERGEPIYNLYFSRLELGREAYLDRLGVRIEHGAFEDSWEEALQAGERVRLTPGEVFTHDSRPLGRVLLAFYHRHDRFEVPRPPEVRPCLDV
jgi:hypothetical protein